MDRSVTERVGGADATENEAGKETSNETPACDKTESTSISPDAGTMRHFDQKPSTGHQTRSGQPLLDMAAKNPGGTIGPVMQAAGGNTALGMPGIVNKYYSSN